MVTVAIIQYNQLKIGQYFPTQYLKTKTSNYVDAALPNKTLCACFSFVGISSSGGSTICQPPPSKDLAGCNLFRIRGGCLRILVVDISLQASDGF